MAKCFLRKYEDLGSMPKTNVKKNSKLGGELGRKRHKSLKPTRQPNLLSIPIQKNTFKKYRW